MSSADNADSMERAFKIFRQQVGEDKESVSLSEVNSAFSRIDNKILSLLNIDQLYSDSLDKALYDYVLNLSELDQDKKQIA